MNLTALLALLAITLTDPTGDAVGDGTLQPPTSPLYANVSLFDLQLVELDVAETGEAVLRVALGSYGPSTAGTAPDAEGQAADAPPVTESEDEAEAARQAEFGSFDLSGLLAVVDVYLDVGSGGATATLSGPDLLMPLDTGWRHAVRISAEGAYGITYTGATAEPEGTPSTASPVTVPPESPEEPPVDGALPDGPEADAEVLDLVPIEVTRRENVLELPLPWLIDPNATIDIYAMTGVHDPFSPDGWRGVSSQPSPWAFSGEGQASPVIDLLAADAETQAAALMDGVLPRPERETGMTLPLSPWLWLMAGGLAIALLGLVLRSRVARATEVGADRADEAAEDEEEGFAVAPSRGADEPAPVATEPEPDAPEHEPAAAAAAKAGGEPEVAEGASALPSEDEAGGSDAGADEEPGGTAAGEAPGTGAPAAPDAPPLEPEGPVATEAGEAPPAAGGAARSPFSTQVEESYLGFSEDDDGREFATGHGEEADESFWHPATRGRSTATGEAATPAASESVVDAEPGAEAEAGAAAGADTLDFEELLELDGSSIPDEEQGS